MPQPNGSTSTKHTPGELLTACFGLIQTEKISEEWSVERLKTTVGNLTGWRQWWALSCIEADEEKAPDDSEMPTSADDTSMSIPNLDDQESGDDISMPSLAGMSENSDQCFCYFEIYL